MHLPYIKNASELVSHGSRNGRKIALEIIEHTLASMDSYKRTTDLVRLTDDAMLRVSDKTYDLTQIESIYVLGAGKASFPIARALRDVLGRRISRGAVIVKKGHGDRLREIEVLEAGHPIPDKASVEGSKKIIKIARSASERDLVFCAITGGASALMSLPVEGISLRDKKIVTKLLLGSGATLYETNTVRKHISAIKGGKLAQYIHPARIVNLIVIDEVEGLPWGPTIPDETTFKGAICVLRKYRLWNKTPSSIKNYLSRGLRHPSLETPKQKDFEKIRLQNVILADNRLACKAAKATAESLGYRSIILSSRLEGESREAGAVLASIAKEVELDREPLEPPCVLVAGGETTVKISGHWGNGGPSQEFALGASLRIAGSEKITIASIDTDGTDGPTQIAGALVDGHTLRRAPMRGTGIFKALLNHSSSNVLTGLGDAIITGPTGTNVADLNLAVITA
jgi:glycerate-2-kinase